MREQRTGTAGGSPHLAVRQASQGIRDA